jgi:hypothetical protein
MRFGSVGERAGGRLFVFVGREAPGGPRRRTDFGAAKASFREGNDDMTKDDASAHESRQLLHLVFGGELNDLDSHEFRDPAKIDIVGVFPDYDSAERAWRGKAQATVDNAHVRYFIVHLHRFLEPTGLNRELA